MTDDVTRHTLVHKNKNKNVRPMTFCYKPMTVGDVYEDTHFLARSRTNPAVIRLYKARRANRLLLLSAFTEAAAADPIPLTTGARVFYAHRNGDIVRCYISSIVHGSAADLSDRDYQLTSVLDRTVVYNTTRTRIARGENVGDRVAH